MEPGTLAGPANPLPGGQRLRRARGEGISWRQPDTIGRRQRPQRSAHSELIDQGNRDRLAALFEQLPSRQAQISW